MKNTIFILFAILLCQSPLFSQNEGPIINDLNTRVPELPQTFPTTIEIDPTRATKPIPEAPPVIAQPSPPAPPNHDSIRNIYWVHGFGGNRDRWADAREASGNPDRNKQGFKARLVDGFAPVYTEAAGLYSAAEDLSNEVVWGTTHQSDSASKFNFLIGHSQGGIVSRFMVSQDHCGAIPFIGKDFYGGLVTFSSSLNGAQMVNNREAGMIDELADLVCNRITAATGPFTRFLIRRLEGGTSDGGNICDAFTSSLLPLLFSGLNKSISLDYVVGSSILETVNSCEAPEVAKVAFYGVEDYDPLPDPDIQFQNPIFYRTVQHFFTDVNFHPTWEANDDSELARQMSEAAEKQLAEYSLKKSWSEFLLLGNLGFPSISYWYGKDLLQQALAHRNLYYLYHDMGDLWLGIIGAIGTEEITTTTISSSTCLCGIEDEGDVYTVTVDADTEAECTHPLSVSCTFQEGTTTTYTATVQFAEKPSDGVVLQESAQYMTGATHPSQLLEIRYFDTGVSNEQNTGSSHMQARNDRNTRDALRALYDGELGTFFKTEIKN